MAGLAAGQQTVAGFVRCAQFRQWVELLDARNLSIYDELLAEKVSSHFRQNTAAVRAATQQAVFEAGLQQHWGVIENEKLRDVMVRARDDPAWATLTPQTSDHILLERFYQQRFNSLENVYYHHLRGTLDFGLWAGWEGWIKGIADDPVMVHFWEKLRGGFMPELVEYMDSILLRPATP